MNTRLFFPLLLLTLTLVSCGKSSDGGIVAPGGSTTQDKKLISGKVVSLSTETFTSSLSSNVIDDQAVKSFMPISKEALKAKLYRVDNKGRPEGQPVAETTTDENGEFQFEVDDDVSDESIEYVSIVTNDDKSFAREAAVSANNIEVGEVSTVTTIGARVASLVTAAIFGEIKPKKFRDLELATLNILKNRSFSSIGDAYDIVIGAPEFRDALKESFVTDVSSADLSRVPPTFLDVIVWKNGVETSDLSFNPGDEIKVKVFAIDPKGLDLQYRFIVARSCSGTQDGQDFSGSNEFTYTIAESDITSCSGIWIGVKNSDGLDFDSSTFGDIQRSVSYNVADDREHPAWGIITKYKNGALYTGTDFKVGDVIKIVANATDPKGLPLQYRFIIFRSCSGTQDGQDFSSSNEFTYTLTEADITTCSGIWIGAKNNDGLDFDSSTMGDIQNTVSYIVSDDREHPEWGSILTYKNDVLYTGNEYLVGDTIKIVANATDPKGLPLQYRFIIFRSCSGTQDGQDFSSSNEFTYTLTVADVTSCSGIWIGAKNNDGLDYDSSTMGDIQNTVGISVVE